MPMPEGAALDFGYSGILTSVALNYLPKLDDFIAGKIFPTVPVAASDGKYNIWKQGDFLRRNGKQIANYEAVPLGGFASAQGSYSVQNWGVGTPYTARDLANARRGGTSDQAFKNAKTRWVVTQGVLEWEFRVQSLIQTTGNWTTTIAGVASAPSAVQFVAWDQAAATPVDDVDLWKRNLRLLTGFRPNTMIIPEKVWLALRKNTNLIDRIKYDGTQARPTEVSLDQIKGLFGIPNIYIPLSVYNNAAEGQTDVFVDLWTQTIMWLGYVADAPSNETPSAGYSFSWTGDTSEGLPADLRGAGPANFDAVQNEQGLFMREYVNRERAAVIIEGMLWKSPNVTSAALGMTWTATVT